MILFSHKPQSASTKQLVVHPTLKLGYQFIRLNPPLCLYPVSSPVSVSCIQSWPLWKDSSLDSANQVQSTSVWRALWSYSGSSKQQPWGQLTVHEGYVQGTEPNYPDFGFCRFYFSFATLVAILYLAAEIYPTSSQTLIITLKACTEKARSSIYCIQSVQNGLKSTYSYVHAVSTIGKRQYGDSHKNQLNLSPNGL